MAEHVIDVTGADFEERVLEESRRVPVVVDFWAPWCGPCRTLGPVLEELAAEGGGAWRLAKVNADDSPDLAARYGVRGIPQVVAFVDGAPVHEFTGALPRDAVEAFLRQVVPTEADRLAREAAEAAGRGERAEELALWTRALEADPDHELARVRRARLWLAEGRLAEAREDLGRVPDQSPLAPDASNLRLLADWADRVRERGGADVVRARAGEDPESVADRFDHGCALALAGEFEGALAEFLEVVRRDRSFEDDAGRRAMLAVFALLGDDHALVVPWRDRLSRELY